MSLVLADYASINDIDPELWKNTFAEDNHPSRTHAFISNVEYAFPERCYKYYLIRTLETDQVAGVFFFSQEALDLSLFIPPKIQVTVGRMMGGVRKLFPSFMKIKVTHAGTPESTKNQWWFNWDKVTPYQAADFLSTALKNSFSSSTIMLLRDFLNPHPPIANRKAPDLIDYLADHFEKIQSYPYALFDCDGLTEENYKTRLRLKVRRTFEENYQKALDLGYKIEVTDNFTHLTDELYPLYTQVAKDAKEFQRTPFPKVFFTRLAEDRKINAYVTLLRSPNNQIVSFILTIVKDKVANPYFFGKPNHKIPEINIYNLLMWHEMLLCLNKNFKHIDMGITNYYPKQCLGAQLQSSRMAISFKSPFKQKLFNRYLPQLLSVAPPKTKRAFKRSE